MCGALPGTILPHRQKCSAEMRISMNKQTRELLQECSSGCKMAVRSIDQVKEYTKEESLELILDRYRKEHENLQEEIIHLLGEEGITPEEPGKMATAMAWTNIEIKMLMEADSHQIAKVMMDGCNMGIQSVSEYKNKYTEASDESISIANKLVNIEERFMEELRAFM